jgi:hypothetical protein
MLPRDLELVGLAPERALELRDPLPQLPLALALLLAGELGLAALEQLVAPAVVEGLGDVVLAADVSHRAVPTEPGEDDLELLLGAELPVPALLCQLDLLRSSGRCCESPRTASLPLRGSSTVRAISVS